MNFIVRLSVGIASQISLRRVLIFFISISGICFQSVAWAAVYTVTNNSDNNLVGSLRHSITQANLNPGSAINFDVGMAGQTITLLSNLPIIEASMTITGLAIPVTVNGNDGMNFHSIFFIVGNHVVDISNLNLNNGLSKGGDGGGGTIGGGGGLGAGGALFVDNLATVNLTDVNFSGNTAQGGSSPSNTWFSNTGSGGGGMLGGNGGFSTRSSGGSGGGGLGANGGDASDLNANGFPGDDGLLVVTLPGGGKGGDNVSFPASHGGAGGEHGGGGGGGALGGPNAERGGGGGGGINGGIAVNATPGNGGDFGGGGGGVNGQGATGGFGGGGGGSSVAGPGGMAGFGGGTGGSILNDSGKGNGGSGFGGAIFVRQGGTLTINNMALHTFIQNNNVFGGLGVQNGAVEGQDLYLMAGVISNFNIGSGLTQNLQGSIGGAGGINVTGVGPDQGTLLLLSSNSTYLGGTRIGNFATVQISSNQCLGGVSGPIIFNGGALNTPAILQLTSELSSTRSVTLNNYGGTIDTGVFNATFSGNFTGAGKLTKMGTGRLTLTGGSSNYGGGTDINNGTVAINSDNALGTAAGMVTLQNGATLAISAPIATSGLRTLTINGVSTINNETSGTVTIAGRVTGPGALTVMGTEGSTTILSHVLNDYMGGTVIQGGTLQVDNDGDLGNHNSAITFTVPNSTLKFDNSFFSDRNITLSSGNNNIVMAVADSALRGNISGVGTLNVIGAFPATLTLSGNNTYQGGTILNAAAIVQIGSDQNLGDPTGPLIFNGTPVNTAMLKLTGALISARAISLNNQGGRIEHNGFNATLSGQISGFGGWIKAGLGDLTLTNPGNNYSGGILVFDGGLKINSDGALGASSGSLILLSASGLYFTSPLEINGSRLISLGNLTSFNNQAVGISTIAGKITDGNSGGTLNFIGVPGSTTILSNHSNDYLNNTSIQGGILQINSDANLGDSNGSVRLDAPNTTLKFAGPVNSNRTITLNAANNFIDTGAFVSTLTGQIVANQPFIVSGNGTLIVSNGANIFPNGIVVQSGTLQGTLASLNANNITKNLSATLVFDQAVTGTFVNTLAGPGNIVKKNVGELIISNLATVTATTTSINGGRLSVNSSNVNPFISPTVNVNSGGTLGGSGYITGNVVNNGIVSPGNSIGTLTITGNYNPTSIGVTNIELNSTGAISVLQITGTANLNGIVTIVPQPGIYPSTGDYTFVTAGNIQGAFLSVIGKIGAFTPELSYIGNTVHLVYSRKAIARNLATGNINETAVGRFLDSIATPAVGSDIGDNVLGPLASLTDVAVLLDALESISPGRMTAGTIAVQENAAMINSIGAARLGGLRQQHKSIGIESHFTALNNHSYKEDPLQALKQLKGKAGIKQKYFNTTRNGIVANAANNIRPLTMSENTKGSVWIYGLGHIADQKSYKLDPGFNGKTAGVMTGADYSPIPDTFVGLGLGKTSTFIGFGNNGGNANVESHFGMLYGTWFPNQWYVDASLWMGSMRYDTHQHIIFPGVDRVANSNHKGFGMTPHVGLGYDFEIDYQTISPFVHLDYNYTHEGAYTTRDAESLNQRVNSRVATALRTETGIKISKLYPFSNEFAKGMIKPSAFLSVIYKKALNKGLMNVNFVGEPGTFTLEYYAQYTTAVSPGVGVDLFFDGNTFLSLHGNSEIGSRYSSFEVAAKLGITF